MSGIPNVIYALWIRIADDGGLGSLDASILYSLGLFLPSTMIQKPQRSHLNQEQTLHKETDGVFIAESFI